MKKIFPQGFFWGASTSSHQVEGDTINDWTRWEKQNAQKLANEAEKKFSWLPAWYQIQNQAMNPENYISGKACEHYTRYEEDFDLLQKLHLNAYRFSLEWSRIEPEKGKYDEEVLEHYKTMILALRRRNIEPFLTLWHWTLPQWLADEGGILAPQIENYFLNYVKKVNERLGEEVQFWITLNEPEVYTSLSYAQKIWPPKQKGIFSYYRCLKNLIKIHIQAWKILSHNKNNQIGIAKNIIYIETKSKNPLSQLTKYFLDRHWNHYFTRRTQKHSTFIGVNYYFHHRVGKWPWINANENKKVSDMGWELYPEGLSILLEKFWKQYKLPLYITEHGLADAQDQHRKWYIQETVSLLHKSIEKGVDLRGYFHWSLLDNFEWHHGFWPRFGLIEIDYKNNNQRRIRKSAEYFSEIAKNNSFNE